MDMPGAKARNDGEEVALGLRQGRGLQIVVPVEFDDAEGRVRLDAEVEPDEPPGGGVARYAGAPHDRVQANPRQGRLELRRQGVGGGQAEAGRNRVPQ
jgi:hypothetical protein